jgi:hypothetical protein
VRVRAGDTGVEGGLLRPWITLSLSDGEGL